MHGALRAAFDALLTASPADPERSAEWRQARADVITAMAASDNGFPVSFQLKGFARAREVAVVGSFNDGSPSPHADPMQRVDGRWQARLRVPPGRHEYKFWVDGDWLLDPAQGRQQADGSGNTNSVLQVPARPEQAGRAGHARVTPPLRQ